MKVELIGVPLDLGANRRGVDMGPSAIRVAGLTPRLQSIGYDVVDSGDLKIGVPEVQAIGNPKLKYLPEITRAVNSLAASVTDVFRKGHLPLVLGGDHSIAIGTIAGMACAFKDEQKKLGVIWIDAHADMNTHETTPSGNIHGMSFAASLGNGAPELINVGGRFTKVRPQDCVLIGARNLDIEEQHHIRRSGITVFSMETIDRKGIFEVMAEAISITTRETHGIHISLDMDALDPQYAPGVGTPVRGGLTYREAHTAMEIISDCGCIQSMEVVEVNPVLDIKNTTAEVAVELVESALGKRIL